MSKDEPRHQREWRTAVTTKESLRRAIRKHTRPDGTVDINGLAEEELGLPPGTYFDVTKLSIAPRPEPK